MDFDRIYKQLADEYDRLQRAAQVLAEFAKTAPGRLPQRVQDAIAAVDANGVMGTQTGPVAWEYANSHGDKFLTHKDPAKWHPHDRAGFKDFRPLAYADGVKGPDKC